MDSVKDYILEAGGFNDTTNWGDQAGVKALRKQVEAVKSPAMKIITDEDAGRYLAESGQWTVYTADAENDLWEVFKSRGSWEDYCAKVAEAVSEILRKEECPMDDDDTIQMDDDSAEEWEHQQALMAQYEEEREHRAGYGD